VAGNALSAHDDPGEIENAKAPVGDGGRLN
jgi:hypothetical protein